MSFIINRNRSCLAVSQECVNVIAKLFGTPSVTVTLVDEPFVRILIHSLIAQAIDRTQWITCLNTIQIRASAVVRPLRIDRLQHTFVHLHNLIEVLANIKVGTHGELTYL